MTRPDDARALLERLGAPPRVVEVDVEDARALARLLATADVVLNATYMRHNVPVTDAAIAAGVHLVDLGSYWPETCAQLERDAAAVAAGSRVVPGCGVAPGLTNVLARLGADALDAVRAVRLFSYITHPLWTSAGIVVTRFDASTGTSVVMEDGELRERPSFGDEELVEFPEPYGAQRVHLVPHPEPVTLPRSSACRTSSSRSATPTTRPRASARCSSSASTGTTRSSSTASRSRRGASPRRTSAAAASLPTSAAPTSSASAWTARATGDRSRWSTTSPSRRPAAPPRPPSPEPSRRSPPTSSPAAATPASGRPRQAFDPQSFLDALADRGLAVSERELR